MSRQELVRAFDGLMGQPFDPCLRDKLREFVVTHSLWGLNTSVCIVQRQLCGCSLKTQNVERITKASAFYVLVSMSI
jgi:hypothetical protein